MASLRVLRSSMRCRLTRAFPRAPSSRFTVVAGNANLRRLPCLPRMFSSVETATSSSSSSSLLNERSYLQEERLSIHNMNARDIREIERIQDLEDLVRQLEAMPELTADDIGPLVVPLMRMTCDHIHGEHGHGEHGAELTERLLFHCLSRLPPDPATRDGDKDLPYPTSSMYNRAIISWGGIKTEAGAQRAQRIFDLMQSEYLQEKARLANQDPPRPPAVAVEPRSPQPCRRTYKSLIRAWVVSGSREGPARAYQLLQEMEEKSGMNRLLKNASAQQNDSGGGTATTLEGPDRATYNLVLSAHAKMFVSKDSGALERIKLITRRMDRLHGITGNDEFALDGYSYQPVLQAYSRHTAYCNQKMDVAYSQEIEEVLKRLCSERRPAIVESIAKCISMPWAYGVLVDALLKTNQVDAIFRAHAIALGLARRQGGIYLPNLTRDSWPRHDTLIRLVRAWERTGIPDAKQHIDQLLGLVVEAPYERIYMLNAGMEEWIKSGYADTPSLIEAMLGRAMNDTSHRSEINGQTFGIAMKAWLRSKSQSAPYRAELLLQKLMELYESRQNSRFEPREVHVRYLMTAWINRCRDGRRYEGLAGYHYPAEHTENLVMQLCHEKWIEKNLVGLFAHGTRAWSLQNVGDGADEPNVVERAASLLNQLDYMIGRLPAYPCNFVLQACARPQPTLERRQEAYHTAIDVFRRCQRNARSFVLIVDVLRAQTNELDGNHLEVIEALFHECCSNGMLTQEMIWNITDVLSPEALKRLFGISHQYATYIAKVRKDSKPVGSEMFPVRWNGSPPNALLVERLPKEWSRNVKGREKKAQS